jgi:hypothetical protein
MQALQSLPSTILQTVIHLAYDNSDWHTLCSCTLVSKSWRAASRNSVYREISIGSEARLEEFEGLLATDPTITSLVHSLVLRLPPDNPDFTNYSLVAKIPRTLSTLLTRLYTIRVIGLRTVHENNEPIDHFIVALSGFAAFATVQSLALYNCTMDTSLLSLFSTSLPAIRELSIEFHHIPRHPPGLIPDSQVPSPQRPLLKTLKLDFGLIFSPAAPAILDWLISTPSRDTLRSVTLTVRISDAEAVGRFLSEVGPVLEELELRFEDYFGLPLETASKPLSCGTQLTK